MSKGKLLLSEVAYWLKAELIDNETAESLRASIQDRYNFNAWYKDASFLLKALAFFIIVSGLFLILSVNWQALPLLIRSSIFLLPLLLVHAYLWSKWNIDQNKRNLDIAVFLSNLLLGLNISAQSQIFHLSKGYYPSGLILWLIGVQFTLILFPSYISSYLAMLLLVVYSVSMIEINIFQHWILIFYLLPLIHIHRRGDAGSGLIGFLSLSVLFSVFFAIELKEVQGFTYFLLNLLFGHWYFGQLHVKRSSSLLRSFQRLITSIYGIVLFVFTYDTDYKFGEIDLYFSMAFILYPALLYLRRDKDKPLLSSLLPPSLIFLAIGFSMLFHSADIDSETSALTVNAMLIGIAVSYLYFGLTYYIKSYYFSAIVIILTLLFLRYLDYFESYLIAGLIFIFFGCSLLFFNKLWEKKAPNFKETQ
jgi:hypothetical protein